MGHHLQQQQFENSCGSSAAGGNTQGELLWLSQALGLGLIHLRALTQTCCLFVGTDGGFVPSKLTGPVRLCRSVSQKLESILLLTTGKRTLPFQVDC